MGGIYGFCIGREVNFGAAEAEDCYLAAHGMVILLLIILVEE